MNKIIFQALCNEINFLIGAKKHAVVAIDGKCASGKSSFAKELAEKYQAPIVHMDDFFLPSSLRTEERLAEAGGNVHYERFMEEVLPGLNKREAFSYRRFDCHVMDYADSITIPASPLVIVEGAYSMHPKFEHYFDMALFMDIDDDKQRQRIAQRNGKDVLKVFQERWIPYENAYFDACRVIDRCDHIIEY